MHESGGSSFCINFLDNFDLICATYSRAVEDENPELNLTLPELSSNYSLIISWLTIRKQEAVEKWSFHFSLDFPIGSIATVMNR